LKKKTKINKTAYCRSRVQKSVSILNPSENLCDCVKLLLVCK
jgi:hypothetical protein